MNLLRPRNAAVHLLHSVLSYHRMLLPRQQCHSFGPLSESLKSIGPIFVINLDRQPERMVAVTRELSRILDVNGRPLSERILRYSAVDAQIGPSKPIKDIVEPFYTLHDQ